MASDLQRLQRAKSAFTTRHVRPEARCTVLTGPLTPDPGDLVLARVDQLGKHARIERTDGRRSALFCGDEIVVCYGNRYATDQYEAEVPSDLGECHLVAGGGVAARVLSQHGMVGNATAITPIGLVGDRKGRRLNLRDWGLPPGAPSAQRPPTIAVVGSAMNAGKTDTAAHLVRGLAAAGFTAGAAKVTGTGSGGDTWLYVDAGASAV